MKLEYYLFFYFAISPLIANAKQEKGITVKVLPGLGGLFGTNVRSRRS
jgi:hypothetical protein